MGMLCEKTEGVTDVSFLLDDGTGRIDCHRWYFVVHFFNLSEIELSRFSESKHYFKFVVKVLCFVTNSW